MGQASSGGRYDFMGKLVYLTGAPASGKTTLGRYLEQNFSNVKYISYRDLLVAQISTGTDLTTEVLRRAPSRRVTAADIQATDTILISTTAELRKSKHVLVDSHAISKETFGFRYTPFKPDHAAQFAPDAIVCLYADPAELSKRIQANPEGRPLPSEFELSMHVTLQATAAAHYAYSVGTPCHFLNSATSLEQLGETMRAILGTDFLREK